MPIIRFRMQKQRFIYETQNKNSMRTLYFDAKTSDSMELNIIGLGYLNKGVLAIREGDPGEEIGRITYVPSYQKPHLSEVVPECFDIDVIIPSSTFETLLTYDERYYDLGFIFRSKHDGKIKDIPASGAVDWHIEDIEEQDFELAESLQISIVPKEKSN